MSVIAVLLIRHPLRAVKAADGRPLLDDVGRRLRQSGRAERLSAPRQSSVVAYSSEVCDQQRDRADPDNQRQCDPPMVEKQHDQAHAECEDHCK